MAKRASRRYASGCCDAAKEATQGRHNPESSKVRKSHTHTARCPTSKFLSRTLALPGITHCPLHRVLLVTTCQCGVALLPFNLDAVPFICSNCGLNWAILPFTKVEPERAEVEQKLLSFYDFFFSQRSPDILLKALEILSINQDNREKWSVSFYKAGTEIQRLYTLLCGLLERDISPRALLTERGHE